ncbi:hypothetical protein ACTXT7_009664, partial [Hymenolepis weldensis]
MANYFIKVGDSYVDKECEFIVALNIECDFQTVELIKNFLIGDAGVNYYSDFGDNFVINNAVLTIDIKISAREGKSYCDDEGDQGNQSLSAGVAIFNIICYSKAHVETPWTLGKNFETQISANCLKISLERRETNREQYAQKLNSEQLQAGVDENPTCTTRVGSSAVSETFH